MITRTNRRPRLILVALLLVLVSGLTFAQYDWGEVVKSSQHVPMENGGGVGYGEVAEAFASFALDVGYAGPLTIEVLVTDIRPGAEYEDDDSRLFLFDAEGNLVAENDDSPFGGYASLLNGVEIEYPGRYYAVVTTYPNSPEMDFDGNLMNIGEEGGSNISFELIVEYGVREGGDYYEEPYYGDAETATWFDDFRALATPIRYTGGELVTDGRVGSGVALYYLTLEEPMAISAEVLVRGDFSQYGSGDSVLYLFDHEGSYVYEDDDSGVDGGSLIHEVYLDRMGGYYLAVVTFPNYPNMDDFGYLEGFPEVGESDIEFELIIGPPREYEDFYGDEYGDALETAIWFDEFRELAIPIRYTSGGFVMLGSVGDGVTLFRITTDEPTSISAEVEVVGDGYGDSVVFIIDSNGFIIAEDDDGGIDGGSLVYDAPLDQPGEYYVAVTSFPNWPNRDDFGYVEGFPRGGEGDFRFKLTVGPPREYDFGDGGFGGEPYPDDGIGANAIDEVAHFSQHIPIANGRGIGAGEVGVGYSAFELVIDEPSYVTIEVVVTEVRQGVSYADSDSMLTLFGEDGAWYATDDDGGMDGASKIESVYLSQPGTYYAIVTTYPNEPETQYGFFSILHPAGESNMAFDLVVRTDFAAQ